MKLSVALALALALGLGTQAAASLGEAPPGEVEIFSHDEEDQCLKIKECWPERLLTFEKTTSLAAVTEVPIPIPWPPLPWPPICPRIICPQI